MQRVPQSVGPATPAARMTADRERRWVQCGERSEEQRCSEEVLAICDNVHPLFSAGPLLISPIGIKFSLYWA